MLYSYHTHTYRCKHARDMEEEYVQRAIACGVKELGFSDHSPYPFPGGFCSGFRMELEKVDDYFETLLHLRDKYKDQIDIHIGFEAEYYPKYFESLLKFLEPYPCEYLILGQHMLGNEIDEPILPPSTKETGDEALLMKFVDQVCEGLRTGAFTYVAHPDVFHYVGPTSIYQKHMTRLCECAKETNTPLEINGLGIRDHRFYPNMDFWPIVGEVGNDVVYGCDAHDAVYAWDDPSYHAALEMVEKFHLHYLDHITLKKPI